MESRRSSHEQEQPSSSQVTSIRPSLARLRPQMSLYNRADLLVEIEAELSKLKPKSTELLYGNALYLLKSSSPLAHLYHLQAANYINRRALHALLCREVKVTDPTLVDRELHFQIGGNLLRFGAREFNMVTGLRIGGSSVDPRKPPEIPERSLFTRAFQRNKLFVGEIRAKFLSGAYSGLDPRDVAKIAEILTLYYMVFCFDYPKKRVHDFIWAIADDEAQWNAFPWGAYAFKILLFYVAGAPRVRTDYKGSGKDGSYHLYGPTWALVVWMVERMPVLVGQIMERIHGVERLPRCLKYDTCDPTIDFTRFFDGHVEVVLMVPTPEEVCAPYFYSGEGDPLAVGFDRPSTKAAKKLMQAAAKAVQIPLSCAGDDVVHTRQTTRSEQPSASGEKTPRT